MPESTQHENRQRTVSAVALFVAYMHACERGDTVAADQYRADLARLDVAIDDNREKSQCLIRKQNEMNR